MVLYHYIFPIFKTSACQCILLRICVTSMTAADSD